MSHFIPSKKNNPCQICGDGSGKCRSSKESDLLLCMTSLDSHSAPSGFRFIRPSKNGLWGVFAPDSDSSISEEWEARRSQSRREHEDKRAQRLKQLLSIEARDKQARAIAKHCGMPVARHQSDLLKRGLSAEQIQEAHRRALLFTWQSEQSISGTTADFPGIDGTGKTRKYGGGYAIAVPNRQGKILGFQIRLDSPNSGGKYLWLSSESIGGASPHLPSGELPIGFYQPFSGEVKGDRYLCEGYLKPMIAAQLHGATFIGASGGNHAGSPEQLEAYLEGCDRAILTPDAGAVSNPNVMHQYRKLNEVLAGQGRSLWVLWYGQTTKADGDIDEISREIFQNASVISWEAFEAIAAPFLPKSEAQDQNAGKAIGKAIGPDPQEYEAYLQWEVEQERVQEELEHRFTVEGVKALFRKLKGAFKGFGKPPTEKSQPIKAGSRITYEAGNLPPAGSGKFTLIFKQSKRSQLIREARQKGYKSLLDTSRTGSGKSFGTAVLEPSAFGINETEDFTLWWTDQNHRNPTVIAAEYNYKDLPIRHNGLITDRDRTTPAGTPHRRHPRKGEIPDIESNCQYADLFHKAQSKGYSSASETAGSNPICLACPAFSFCGQTSGDGFGFRFERREAFRNNQIRASLDSLPRPSDHDYRNDVIILEEAGSILNPLKKLDLSLQDFDSAWAKLECELPDYHSALAQARKALRPMIAGDRTQHHGFNDFAIREAIGEFPSGIDIDLIAALMPDTLASILEGKIEKPQDSDIVEESEELAKLVQSIKGRLKRRSQKLDNLKAKCDRDPSDELKQQIDALEHEVEELTKELEIQKGYLKGFQSFNRTERKAASREANQKNRQTLIETIESLPVNGLVSFLKIWSGQIDGAMRIGPFGGMIITERTYRQAELLKAVGFSVGLDATLSLEKYSLLTDIPEDQILHIEQESDPVTNLTVNQVRGFNMASKGRSESTDKRIAAFITAIQEKHGSQNVATLDHFAKAGDSGADGWHFGNDARGSNRFEAMKALIIVGLPKPNFGVIEDLWIVFGCPGDLNDFYRAEIDVANLQEYGRLRANRRPDEELTIYQCFDCDRSKFEYQIPVDHQVIDAVEIAPEAGSAIDRLKLAMKRAADELIANGQKITQTAIASLCGLSQGYIARHWRLLQLLLDPLYRSCNNPGEENQTPEEDSLLSVSASALEGAIALRGIEERLQAIDEVFHSWLKPSQWQRLWARLSASTQVLVLEVLLPVLPLEELEAIAL